MICFFIEVEVVVNAVKKGAGSSVEGSLIHFSVIVLVLGKLLFESEEYAFLRVSFFALFQSSVKGVVVVAVVVDIFIDKGVL